MLYIDFNFYRIHLQFALHFDTVTVSISRPFGVIETHTHTHTLLGNYLLFAVADLPMNKTQSQKKNAHTHIDSYRESTLEHHLKQTLLPAESLKYELFCLLNCDPAGAKAIKLIKNQLELLQQ